MNWQTVQIGDVCAVGDGAHAKVERQLLGIPYLTSKNIGQGSLLLSKFDFISNEDYDRLFSSKSKAITRPQVDDVLIGIIGTFGTHYRYSESDKFGVSSSVAILRPLQEKLYGKYLNYVVSSPDFKNAHAEVKGGSVQGYTNLPTIRILPVPLPPIGIQRRIASILGSLDDKIELNRRMNETLEEMARTIFRSWFVDFDPVRVKARGGDPVKELGISPEIAALFPDSFENSELGEVPEGWRASTVGEEFRLTMGQSPPGESYNTFGEGIPFYQGKTDYGWRFPSRRLSCTAPTRFAEEGDTLVSVRAPVGSLNIAHERCCIGRGLAAIRHLSGSMSLTYYAMGELANHFKVFEESGTIFGSITKQGFVGLPFVAPPLSVTLAFDKIVQALDFQIEANDKESATLAETRDFLLPRLLSGEVTLEGGLTREVTGVMN